MTLSTYIKIIISGNYLGFLIHLKTTTKKYITLELNLYKEEKENDVHTKINFINNIKVPSCEKHEAKEAACFLQVGDI